MDGFTIVNLKEVEDLAPKFGFSPGLESRFARGALELENSGISYFKIAPGFRPSGTQIYRTLLPRKNPPRPFETPSCGC